MAYGVISGQTPNVLTPATAVKLGLDPTANADDAFNKLSASVLQQKQVIGQTIKWDKLNPPTGVKISTAFTPNPFVQVEDKAIWTDGTSEEIYSTTNNFSSIRTFSGLPSSVGCCFYFKNKFFCTCHAALYYTEDCISWSKVGAEVFTELNTLVSANDTTVALSPSGAYNTFYISEDGLNYKAVSLNGLFDNIDHILTYKNPRGESMVAILGDKNVHFRLAIFNISTTAYDTIFDGGEREYYQGVYDENTQKLILIPEYGNITRTELLIYDTKNKVSSKVDLHTPLGASAKGGLPIIVNGNIWFFDSKLSKVCWIKNNYTEIIEVYSIGTESRGQLYYDQKTERFICIALKYYSTIVYQASAISYGKLTPLTQNQLTDINNVPIQISNSQILGGVRIETGNYTGNGRYGSSNPNSLTFGFEPKLVIISGSGTYINFYFWNNVGKNMCGANDYASALKVTALEKTMSWYHPSNVDGQLNASNTSYNYLAIG